MAAAIFPERIENESVFKNIGCPTGWGLASGPTRSRESNCTRQEWDVATRLEHVLLLWNRLRCVRARRSARRAAKSDAVTSVERRNEVGARPPATLEGRGLLRRGFVEGLGRSARYALRPSPARAAKSPRRRRFHRRRTCSNPGPVHNWQGPQTGREAGH